MFVDVFVQNLGRCLDLRTALGRGFRMLLTIGQSIMVPRVLIHSGAAGNARGHEALIKRTSSIHNRVLLTMTY